MNPTPEQIKLHEELDKAFPLWFCFVEKSKKKTRLNWKKKHHGQSHANKYAIITVLLNTINDLGTAKRSLKHKGYPIMAGAWFPTEQEVQRHKSLYRLMFYKHKNFDHLYSDREFWNNEFKEVIERMKTLFPITEYGQSKLIFPET